MKLKSDKPMTISFPKKEDENGMHLFKGVETKDGVNWKSQLDDVIVVEEIEEDIEVPFAVIENVPIYPSK